MKMTDRTQSNLGVTAAPTAVVVTVDGNGKKVEPRIDPFLYGYFAVYARDLREEFPGHKIRNATVIEAAVQEFARRGLITLVKAHEAIPEWLPPAKVKLVKAKNGWPIWMPTRKLLDNWIDIQCALTPVFLDGSVRWTVRTAARVTAALPPTIDPKARTVSPPVL
jgi:hypothetical protein